MDHFLKVIFSITAKHQLDKRDYNTTQRKKIRWISKRIDDIEPTNFFAVPITFYMSQHNFFLNLQKNLLRALISSWDGKKRLQVLYKESDLLILQIFFLRALSKSESVKNDRLITKKSVTDSIS